jgi:hypothetical protein
MHAQSLQPLDVMVAKVKGRFIMKPTGMHLVGVATVLSAIAIAAPVSSASAATPAPAGAPVAVRAAAVTPQTFVTTSPTTFINYNSQTSAGSTSAGSQVAG